MSFGKHPDESLGGAIEAQKGITADLVREANLEGRLQGIEAVMFWMDNGFTPTAAMYRAMQDIRKEMKEHDAT